MNITVVAFGEFDPRLLAPHFTIQRKSTVGAIGDMMLPEDSPPAQDACQNSVQPKLDCAEILSELAHYPAPKKTQINKEKGQTHQ